VKRQKLEIGHPLKIAVYWYDRVPAAERNTTYEGEVVGWRDSQLIVRVPDYAVIRFWKANGLEVGNPDHERRGFRVDLSELEASIKPAPGIEVAIDTDA
jgi:hypothetical protein